MIVKMKAGLIAAIRGKTNVSRVTATTRSTFAADTNDAERGASDSVISKRLKAASFSNDISTLEMFVPI